jgi:hypothetical protein
LKGKKNGNTTAAATNQQSIVLTGHHDGASVPPREGEMKARDLLKQSTRLSIGVAGKIRSPSGTANYCTQATSASEQINREN